MYKFTTRKGLEGPWQYPNGQTLHYDPSEGQYYDPLTDFYISHEDMAVIQQQMFDKIAGNHL